MSEVFVLVGCWKALRKSVCSKQCHVECCEAVLIVNLRRRKNKTEKTPV